MSLFSCIRCIAKCSIFIVVAIFSIQFWLERKSYLFDEKAVSGIAKDHVGTTDPQMSYQKILATFQRRYPGHILGDGDMQWIFINAGGWMGSMCLVHASLTEYVLFFGTAFRTSGHSGRYWANISDTILTGSFRQWKEGEINSVVYKPGDVVHHAWGEVAAVEWEGHTWMVEYGRGFIPSTLGFALSDTLFSTQDFVTLFYVLRIYAKALSLEVIAAWTDVRTAIKDML